MTPIGAPEFNKTLFNSCSSDNLKSVGGNGNNADPPPQISAITRSSAVNPSSTSKILLAALNPFSSGTG